MNEDRVDAKRTNSTIKQYESTNSDLEDLIFLLPTDDKVPSLHFKDRRERTLS